MALGTIDDIKRLTETDPRVRAAVSTVVSSKSMQDAIQNNQDQPNVSTQTMRAAIQSANTGSSGGHSPAPKVSLTLDSTPIGDLNRVDGHAVGKQEQIEANQSRPQAQHGHSQDRTPVIETNEPSAEPTVQTDQPVTATGQGKGRIAQALLQTKELPKQEVKKVDIGSDNLTREAMAKNEAQNSSKPSPKPDDQSLTTAAGTTIQKDGLTRSTQESFQKGIGGGLGKKSGALNGKSISNVEIVANTKLPSSPPPTPKRDAPPSRMLPPSR